MPFVLSRIGTWFSTRPKLLVCSQLLMYIVVYLWPAGRPTLAVVSYV